MINLPLNMFQVISHIYGAIGVRVRRISLSKNGYPDLSFINENLAIGGVSNIESLSRSGIESILDLREESQDDPIELKKYSINYMRIGIKDRNAPTKNQTIQAVNWLKKNISEGKKVFLHCNLGRGRAPAIAVLYLISQGLSAEDAITTIKKVRKYSYFNRTQLNMIYKLEKQLN